MSTLALLAVQKALYNKFHGDGVLMGMVHGVYDSVPQRTVFPYIVIGNGTQLVEAAEAANVTECRLNIDIWTDAAGRKTALTILNRLHALTHLGTLSLEGFSAVILRVEQASVRVTEENTCVNGVLILRVTVAEA